jgi:3-methyladenine DNA glycosylase AlkC
MRKGARRMADIPAQLLAALNDGSAESQSLTEGLAIDFATLMQAVCPGVDVSPLQQGQGITRRMAVAGQILYDQGGLSALPPWMGHQSDTVRGWAAYAIAACPDLPLDQRLTLLRPLADDPHFGVREWAWLAVRPHCLPRMVDAIGLLVPWTHEASPFLRRFASELTRPRGVWCSHSASLRADPALGLPILQPLRNDPEKYVQDSVANWLNDAGKDHPQWLRDLAGQWDQDSPHAATRRILKRGMRSLRDE